MRPSVAAMIQLHAVHHHFGERPVLRGLDLTLSERRIGVVGGNGSGKSTFARLLNGLLVPERGRVLVDGLDTRTHARAVRRQVGFVFQNPDHQIVLPTVEEDLAFGLKNLKLSPTDIAERVTTALRRYDLEALRHHPAHLLSGGQKQLLALSGVLVMAPRYIVFDEPTTLLDLRNRRRFAQAIHELPQTTIVVSHDLELLRDFERVLVFDEGRVVHDDVPATALDAYVRSMA
ncbi:ATPase component BioM of energizing module of biotin ECF transporter [Cystobacter fuscus DSM 2262]|uniref:ATPase component BioM of energizing module of biotin ECF transporter n=1 Tax=Cystobacter fuscus (strain ATCC 25194 / DSM 2262 / NBRC 100088 / M29) TaxID=1242864 RepID=S9Q320_CYSF2|nr:ABC transporter ATP-binding protein [Cystobacter fuscus]EPX55704.1 ATPase component BioM of energizing module of biotin ECF transporter [Cystobacter fuscus DSM 2262]